MPIPRDIVLTTPRLTLRPTSPEDARRFFEIQSNWNVTRMLRLAPWPPDPEVMAAWVASHAEEWAAGSAFRFAVLADGAVIGCADADDFDGEKGEIGYWFDEAAWGRGYAAEAGAAVVDFVFSRTDVRRLEAGRLAENPASGRVLEKLGFRRTYDGVRWSRSRGAQVEYCFYRLDRPYSRAG
ncbi:GNAT family N-acetyltransferase [Phenylobacterium terrae]|uniref:GNAT family N-acetyltransferase n=1 Tax=Phenylobacterium terrae TaxID=2665495 RepID=A0ABW4N4D3_9CAUL